MINILYAGNKKAFVDNFVSVLSMCENTSEELNIYFLTIHIPKIEPKGRPLTKEHEAFMDNLVKSYNIKSFYKVIDVTNIYLECFKDSKNLYNHFSPYTLIRLVAEKVDLPDKLIYLDNDTIVHQNIKEFYSIDISRHELGVVKDIYRPFWSQYFNAGVLLINMKKVKESKLFTRAIKLLNQKKYLFADQSVLNILTRKTKLMLPRKYNAMENGNSKGVIHHICNVRASKIFLSPKWFKRLKTVNLDIIEKKITNAKIYYDKLKKVKLNNPELF